MTRACRTGGASRARLADFLVPSPKFAGRGVHRTLPPAETCRRMEPVARRIGVTRIADITGLDRLGIPTWSCIRPGADEANVTVTCGKGTSAAHAKAGAIMEAIEYHSAERALLQVRTASFEELSRGTRVLDPRDLVLPVWSPYRPDLPIDWVPAKDLATGEEWFVPANAAFHPYIPAGDRPILLRGSTNGLASGNTIEEAVCHALAEAIERDSWSLAWVRIRYGQGDRFPGLSIGPVSRELAWLLARFESAGVRLYLRDVTSQVGVPTYYAGSLEPVGERWLAHEGMGAHPDPEVALARAITEVAQSRAADIQGSREDLGYWRRRAGEWKEKPESWSVSLPARRVEFPGQGGARHADVLEDIGWMLERLAERGLSRAYVVDLTHPEVGVPVVRVLVPGLEFVAVDEYRAGPRALAAAREAGAPVP